MEEGLDMVGKSKIVTWIIGLIMLVSIFLPTTLVLADENKIEILEQGDYFKENQENSLLVGKDGQDLQRIQQGKGLYELDQVGITRYRQKVHIEYYMGDYFDSQLIGIDEGYGDYGDYVSDYMLKIPAINEKFNASIPLNYKLVPYSKSDRSVYSKIPAYTGVEEIKTVKVLIAEVKKYSVSAIKYQNRQDLTEQPNPVGQSKGAIEALSQYWKVNSLSTSFSAIAGQEVDFKDVGQFTDSFTAGTRTGDLKYYGKYDDAGNFESLRTFVVPKNLTGTISLAGFYAVEDLGTPAVNPGYSSSFTSGAGVGFLGDELSWKSEKVSELLSVKDADSFQKLSAYPFQLAADPFDHPEYESNYWTPENFALGHKLEITYYYNKVGTVESLYTVNFESNGGSPVARIENVSEGTKLNAPDNPEYTGFIFDGWYKEATLENKWDFNLDVVNSDMTLFAKWLPSEHSEEETNGSTSTKEKDTLSLAEANSTPSKSLPKTGANSFLFLGGVLLIIGSCLSLLNKTTAGKYNKK